MISSVIKQQKKIKLLILYSPQLIYLNGGISRFIKNLFLHTIKGALHGLYSFAGISDLEAVSIKGRFNLSKIEELHQVKKKYIQNLFSKDSKVGYVLLCPNYVSFSAGIKSLYILCDRLNSLGYPTYIAGSFIPAPDLVNPIITLGEAKELVKKGFIAIYSETIFGNPLGAKKVARIVGNRPGLLGGDDKYDENEVVFSYSKSYVEHIKNKVAGILYIPTIDESLFFNDSRPFSSRSLELFYVGKSCYKDGFFRKESAFEITRNSPKKEDLGTLFRAAKILYTFDNSTILTYEAILCGCPVVIIPDGSADFQDYEKYELGFSGISWGVGNIDSCYADVDKTYMKYQQVKRDFDNQLQNFIDKTQN